jgi:hypothetical protein
MVTRKEIESEGKLLDEYPTDDFDGSNSGEGELYYYKGYFYELTKEIDGNRKRLGKIKDKEQINIFKKRYNI